MPHRYVRAGHRRPNPSIASATARVDPAGRLRPRQLPFGALRIPMRLADDQAEVERDAEMFVHQLGHARFSGEIDEGGVHILVDPDRLAVADHPVVQLRFADAFARSRAKPARSGRAAPRAHAWRERSSMRSCLTRPQTTTCLGAVIAIVLHLIGDQPTGQVQRPIDRLPVVIGRPDDRSAPITAEYWLYAAGNDGAAWGHLGEPDAVRTDRQQARHGWRAANSHRIAHRSRYLRPPTASPWRTPRTVSRPAHPVRRRSPNSPHRARTSGGFTQRGVSDVVGGQRDQIDRHLGLARPRRASGNSAMSPPARCRHGRSRWPSGSYVSPAAPR